METLPQPSLAAKALPKPACTDKLLKYSGDVTELRNKYGYNLPPIATLHRLYDRERNKQIIDSIMQSDNVTPTVVRLLFTGRLPIGYFHDLCYGQKQQAPNKPTTTVQPTRERVRELWEPKRHYVMSAMEIERTGYEARVRHRHRLEAISHKAHAHFKDVEDVMMRHLLIESRGMTCYLQKLERRKQKAKEKQSN